MKERTFGKSGQSAAETAAGVTKVYGSELVVGWYVQRLE